MMKAGLLAFGGSWLLVLVLAVTGHLAWDNGLLWLPFAGFPLATLLGLVAAGQAEQRGPALLLAAVAFASALAFCLARVLLFVFSTGF